MSASASEKGQRVHMRIHVIGKVPRKIEKLLIRRRHLAADPGNPTVKNTARSW